MNSYKKHCGKAEIARAQAISPFATMLFQSIHIQQQKTLENIVREM